MLDSHVHFWQYDATRNPRITGKMGILKQDYLPGQLSSVLHNNGMAGCIAVPAEESELETHFLLELEGKYDFIKGIVGWIDINGKDFAQRFDHFSGFAAIKGWLFDPGEATEFSPSIVSPVRQFAAAGYCIDLSVNTLQLPLAIRLAEEVSEGSFILDHCGKPVIEKTVPAGWAADIRAIAQNPGVSCKLSGLFTQAPWKQWSAADFYPYLDVVFEAFGPERLLFGSDWPVILLSGMYVQWKSLLLKYMEQLDEDIIAAVMGGNAARLYKLES